MESNLHIDAEQRGSIVCLEIAGDMNIYAAPELQRRFQAALAVHHGIELNLSGVSELDSAGLQQLYLLEREARRASKQVRIPAISAAARELFELYGVQAFLKDDAEGAPHVITGRAMTGAGARRSEAAPVTSFDAVIPTFIAEAAELLDGLESSLLELARTPDRPDLVNSAFRAAHTIKGAAGLFDFDGVVRFTHRVESLLARLRDDASDIDAAATQLLLCCCDHLRALIAAETRRAPLEQRAIEAGLALEAELRRRAPTTTLSTAPRMQGTDWTVADASNDERGGSIRRAWHISARFGRDVLRHGMDPASILLYLKGLGEIIQIATSLEAMPDAALVDARSCYLGFELVLRTAASQARIEGAFEFVRDDCQLQILPADAVREDDVREIVAQKRPAAAPRASLEPHVRPPEARDGQLVRVQAQKLDQLIDLVGELMVASATACLCAERSGRVELLEANVDLARLVEEARNHALGLRMVPIGSTFQRFARVVHDVSAELGKGIDLIISGGENELDKAVVEQLSEPLLHLVRNAIAHGIEPMDVRIAQGKSERGRIHLNARHDSGGIMVEVCDDGAGLERGRILQKGIERGLVSSDCQLSDAEVYALIFEAGFSTAERVSDLSGRGVGMDIVKRKIEALRGSVELESVEGRGATVRLRLPLTLAIIDGFLVGLGSERYVIPLDTVLECLAFGAAEQLSAQQRGFIILRGSVLPIVRLRERLRTKAPAPERENVIVVRWAGAQIGLVVDELLGELQAVIKPLGTLFSRTRGISGSALLGSGQVALILDIYHLLQASGPGSPRLEGDVPSGRMPRALASGA